MNQKELREKGKLLSKKYHWHFDRSLKYRELLSSCSKNTTEYSMYQGLMIDSEIRCSILDEKIGNVFQQLRCIKENEKQRK